MLSSAILRSQAVLRSQSVPRSQAIPMTAYRRRIFLNHIHPYPLIVAMALIAYHLAVYRSELSVPIEMAISRPHQTQAVPRDCAADSADCMDRPELTSPDAIPQPPPPPPAGEGAAPLRGIGSVSLTNIKIAASMIDGTVVPPGGKFSFDDAAHTWDFHEDQKYLMSAATSVNGIIYMRGGGVCWLSTAIWNAALHAGLPTEYRQNHYGLVPLLGAGLDATNTLVIGNDSDQPVTIRTWLDDTNVHAELDTPRPLDRTATIDGPYAKGGGRYVTYQDITWDDGSETQNEFDSHYYW